MSVKKQVPESLQKKIPETVGALKVLSFIPTSTLAGGYLVLEEPPATKIVTFFKKDYFIPLPWVYYKMWIAKISGNYVGRIMKIYCKGTKPTLNSDIVVSLPLPNMYGSRPCYFYTNPNIGSIEELVQYHLLRFWEARSNTDGTWKNLIWQAIKKNAKNLKDLDPTTKTHKVLEAWEELSIVDIRALPWPTTKLKSTTTYDILIHKAL